MKNKFLKLFAVFITSFHGFVSSAFAIDFVDVDGISTATINSELRDPDASMFFGAANQRIRILSPGDVISSGFSIAGFGDGTLASLGGLRIEINTASTKGISSDGIGIDIYKAELSSLSLTSGRITAAAGGFDVDGTLNGTLMLENSADGGTNVITLASGTSISNTAATGGVAINYNTASRLGDVDASNATLNITNSGTISAANHSSSAAIYFKDTSGGSVLNVTNNVSGVITAGDSGKAFDVIDAEANITNRGTITGAISLGDNAASEITVAGGTVSNNILLGHASQVVTLGSHLGVGSTIGGNISGGFGAVNIAASGTASVAGSIDVNTIALAGELNLTNSSGNTITADITGAGTGNLSLNTYTHSLTGDLDLNSGDILSVGIASPDSAGKITASGIASTSSGTILHASLVNSSGTTTVGKSYVIMRGGTGSTITRIADSNITLDGVATNRYGAYVFTTSVDGDDLVLSVGRIAMPEVAANANQLNAYNNVIGFNLPNGNLLTMQRYLDTGLYTASQKSAALNSATPQTDNSSNRLAFNNVNLAANLIGNRLASMRNNKSFYNVLDRTKANKSSWAEVFGTNVNQDSSVDSDGYRARSAGFIMGYDKKIDNVILGIAGSYSGSSIESSNNIKETNISSYQIDAYSGHNFDNVFVNNVIGFSYNEYISKRSIAVVGANARAKYSGQTYMARSEMGYNYKFENAAIITPTFAVTAARNSISHYNENDAGNLSLSVRNNSANFFETRGGLALSKEYKIFSQKITPAIYTSYGYDFAGAKQKSINNFSGQGTSFATTGAKIGQGSLRVGTGVKVAQTDSLALSVGYEFEHRIGYDSHLGSFKAKYSF